MAAAYRKKTLPDAVLDCMIGARAPCEREVQEVAARIWAESHPGARSWRHLVPGTTEHCQMIRAACAALGVASRPVRTTSSKRSFVDQADGLSCPRSRASPEGEARCL